VLTAALQSSRVAIYIAISFLENHNDTRVSSIIEAKISVIDLLHLLYHIS